jgi:hypothetical protein
MSAATDALATATDALSTATTAVENAVTDLSSTVASPADNVLAAVIAALEAQGYTVTAPAPADASELPASDSSDATDTTA